MLPSLKCEEQFGDLSLCRFLISLRNSRAIMTVTLACDHRILYGARAERFLSLVKELLERPESL